PQPALHLSPPLFGSSGPLFFCPLPIGLWLDLCSLSFIFGLGHCVPAAESPGPPQAIGSGNEPATCTESLPSLFFIRSRGHARVGKISNTAPKPGHNSIAFNALQKCRERTQGSKLPKSLACKTRENSS